MKKIMVISGPNLNLFGYPEGSIYGEGSLEDIHEGLRKRAAELGVEVDCFQFNSEEPSSISFRKPRESMRG